MHHCQNDYNTRSIQKSMKDYKIEEHYLNKDQTRPVKFLISLGGKQITVADTFEAAARIVVKLAIDPWHLDRFGYTYKKEKPKYQRWNTVYS